MEVKGYKAFNSNMTNRYGFTYEEGKTYKVSNNESIKFGNNGNGFHFCKRLEDTLRYFPEVDEEIRIAEVTGSGEYDEGYDDYYGYYDMFATEIITIDRILERDEILRMILSMNPSERVKRFIMGFKLTKEELELFRYRFVTSQEKTVETYTPNNELMYDYIHIIKEIDRVLTIEEIKRKLKTEKSVQFYKRKQ